VATEVAAVFPLAVKPILENGLALRDRYREKQISLHGLWTATGRLEARLDRLLRSHYRDPANQRLAKHLRHERPYLFTFLYCPGLVDATNNVAERVMRLLVVLRKNWGGNRTENGARAQAVLTSILCTARQQDQDAFALLTDLLRSPQGKVLGSRPTREPAVARAGGTLSLLRLPGAVRCALALLGSADAEVFGTITLVYNHHARLVSEKLTDSQHTYYAAIMSTVHVQV
jgi:hypothetical protein